MVGHRGGVVRAMVGLAVVGLAVSSIRDQTASATTDTAASPIPFGDAGFFGSMGGQQLAAPVVAMDATPDGGGYWLVGADGGVFTFGDAHFYGSAANLHLGAPIVAMDATPDGGGYWLVGADGGVFTFGDAHLYGSARGKSLTVPTVAMGATPDGRGYWLVGADGGVLTFGDAHFYGSAGGQNLAVPIIAMAASPDGGGYWLLPTGPPSSRTSPSATVIRTLFDVAGYHVGQEVVALTFDDGPSPTYTPQILRILTADHVPASFSIIGRQGAADTGILGQEAADGFALVNHTWDHVNLAALPAAEWPAEVDRTDTLLAGALGHPVRCLRPPYGDAGPAVVNGLAQRGLAELLWSIDPSDYLRPGATTIASRVLSALRPGAIILLHDGGGDRSQTVAALPTIISGIQTAGYRIVPVCT